MNKGSEERGQFNATSSSRLVVEKKKTKQKPNQGFIVVKFPNDSHRQTKCGCSKCAKN